MPKYFVLRNYSSKQDAALADFGLHVAGNMTGNTSYPTPKVTPEQLTTASTALANAIAARPDTGQQGTAIKNAARTALTGLLDQLVDYIEFTVGNDEVKLRSSGFDVTSSARPSQAPVGATSIAAVTNLGSGIMGFKFTPADNSWAIEVQSSVAAGTWVHGETFTNPRDAQLTGLTPGTMYAFRARALGSGNQKSAWSDPVSHMAT